MTFKNKTLIITGAAQGIGFEIAKQLAQKEVNIVFNDMDNNLGLSAQKVLQDLGNCRFVLGDSGDLGVIKELIDTAISEFGSLDFVIANAGITTSCPFLAYTKEKLDQLLHVNIQGTFFLAQQAAKQMLKQNTAGRIIMLSSTTGIQPHDELEAYGMTKAAIAFLAKSLGTKLAPNGITVNAISPGATVTERTVSVAGYEEGWAKLIPTRKVSKTSDIAATAIFLLSDGAGQLTGQNLAVDGGWLNVGPMPDAI